VAEEKGSPRTIRVVDRRRFTVEGDPRDDVSGKAKSTPVVGSAGVAGPDPDPHAPAAVPATQAADGAAAQAAAPPSPKKEAATTSPVFVELVATLAQQAELLLIGADGIPAEPEQARRMIDYLAVLESKTAGNLSPEEAEVLSSVVFQLRALFIQRR
jgi:hypothetical protein